MSVGIGFGLVRISNCRQCLANEGKAPADETFRERGSCDSLPCLELEGIDARRRHRDGRTAFVRELREFVCQLAIRFVTP